MSRNIFNLKTLGQYDFGLQTIEINVDHILQEKSYIEEIINTPDFNSLSNTELEIYKTIRHEFTHLLDSTTTLWGMEYTSRMYHWFGNPIDRNLEVFLLNDTEIQMHHKLNISHKVSPIYEIKYSVEYNEDIGVYILIHYVDELNGLIQSTPVTMLSVLEVHAYAQEHLFEYNLHNKVNDIVAKKILDRKIQKDINTLTISEYTCLLALLDKLLPIHSLQSKLEIIIVAARLALNLPDFLMAIIPELILKYIYNKAGSQLISSLQMELSRGMHRSTLCMIFIVSFCMSKQNDNERLSFSEIEEIMLEVFTNSQRNLESVKKMMHMHWNIVHEVTVDLLSSKNAQLASNMARQHKDSSWYEFDLSTTLLPDFYISTGEIVEMPNRISFDIDVHLDRNMTSVMALEKRINEIKLMRQHLTPAVYHDMNERRKAGDFSTIYYPNSSNSL